MIHDVVSYGISWFDLRIVPREQRMMHTQLDDDSMQQSTGHDHVFG